MPTIEENRTDWSESYQWTQGGDEWSKEWGTAQMQWFGSLLPRINSFLPAPTILEIAPGYGRWTVYLKSLCKQLIVVDLSAPCIEKCKERFAQDSHISYFVNDGTSLEMVKDNSIDFIFSFDSLVHAEQEVLKAYAAQFAKKLRPDGVAFIHHSNLGEYERIRAVQLSLSKIPKLVGGLSRLRVFDDVTYQWRAPSMTASKMALFAEQDNLQCISQELVTWQTNSALIDCFSTIVRSGSRWARPNRILHNPGFMREAKYLRKLTSLYNSGQDANHNNVP